MLFVFQAEKPEEDPDVRGGGLAADAERVVKGADYASDEEEPLRNEVGPLSFRCFVGNWLMPMRCAEVASRHEVARGCRLAA